MIKNRTILYRWWPVLPLLAPLTVYGATPIDENLPLPESDSDEEVYVSSPGQTTGKSTMNTPQQDIDSTLLHEYTQEVAKKEYQVKQLAAGQTVIIILLAGSACADKLRSSSGQEKKTRSREMGYEEEGKDTATQ